MTTYSRRELTPSLILIAVSAAGLLGVVGTSCSSSASGQQTCAGVVNCLCRPDGSCNSGLMCSAGVCVAASGTAGSGAGGSGTGASGAGGSGTGTGGGSGTGASGTGGSGAGTGGGAAGTTGAGGSSTGGAGGNASSGGPVILNLSTNVTQMTPSTTLVVTAVVTHPQGITQVVGGTLSDPPAGGTYGAFQVSTTAGSFSLTLTWTEIEAVRDITTPGGGAARSFRAQFFDQSGRTTTQDVSVTMWCGDATSAACGGTCEFLATDKFNCGACGHSCLAFPGANNSVGAATTCTAGKCTKVMIVSSTAASCQNVCGADGLVCDGNSFNSIFSCTPSMGSTVTVDCATVPMVTTTTVCKTFSSISCVCKE